MGSGLGEVPNRSRSFGIPTRAMSASSYRNNGGTPSRTDRDTKREIEGETRRVRVYYVPPGTRPGQRSWCWGRIPRKEMLPSARDSSWLILLHGDTIHAVGDENINFRYAISRYTPI